MIVFGSLLFLLLLFFILSFNGIFVEREIPKNIKEEQIKKSEGLSEEYYGCLALVNNDINICNKTNVSSKCINNYYANSFFKNDKFCNELSGNRNIICRAYHQNKEKLCRQIDSREYRLICFALSTNNEDGCKNHTGCRGKFSFVKALKNENVSLCSRAKGKGYNTVNMCKAILNDDDSLCMEFARDYIRKFKSEAHINSLK